jgi:hypothetical protein
VLGIEASSDVTPWTLCKEAETTLSVLIGEQVARGWTKTVKTRLAGAASCTHLMEMLIPMATVALQGIGGIDPNRVRDLMSEEGAKRKIDSCFAYGRQRDVVRLLWPSHHRVGRSEEGS